MITVQGQNYRLIGAEEHYVLPEYVEATRDILLGAELHDLDLEDMRFFLHHPNGKPWHDPLLDLGEARLRQMDEAGVDMQILSLIPPGVQFFEPDRAVALATMLNDRLAEIVRRHPTRFAGLAVVPPQAAAQGAKELERAIRKLGLHGLVINSHTGGEYLDDPKFWPIFEAAEALDCAIYMHPRNPPKETRRLFESIEGQKILVSGIFAFQIETCLHALRLMVCGVFDRFPKLKIVLGHMGEGIPYWLYRLDYMYERGYRKQGTGLAKRLPSEYFRDNFFVTISGMNSHELSPPTLEYCHNMVGSDRLLFATDHPFQSMKDTADVLHKVSFSADALRKITHANAESLFHIEPQKEAPLR